MVIVAEEDRPNHREKTSRTGHASYCRRCCASQTTIVDGRPLQRKRLLEYPNDARASRELVFGVPPIYPDAEAKPTVHRTMTTERNATVLLIPPSLAQLLNKRRIKKKINK